MIKIFISAIVAVLFLTGCGHNMIAYSDGVGLETTLNPETYTVGLNFRYGKILTVCVRENSEIEMNGKTELNSSDTTKNSVDGSVKVKIGNQINGYTVDLEKVKNGH